MLAIFPPIFQTWCFVLAFLWAPILAEDEEDLDTVDRDQKKRQTILSTAETLPASFYHAPSVATSAALVATPTATVAPIVHATPAPILHAPAPSIVAAPAHIPFTRTVVPIARPVAFPLPAPADIPYSFSFPFHKPAIPFHVAPYPALTHAFAPAPIFLPHTQYPLATATSTTALKVLPAPNLAPSFAPVYRYGVEPYGFGYHSALKYF